MAKTNKKNGSDNDKPEILRAEDIIPHSKGNDKQSHSPSQDGQPKVPQFDLAEEIMAEHRKIASVKRKSPNQKIEPLITIDELKSKETTKGPVIEPIAEQVIKEIVARDIERLRQGK